MSDFLVDTNIFIAAERREPVGSPPEGKARISVVTLTELLMGALAAPHSAKAGRERTLAKANSFVPLSYDEAVAGAVAKLLAAARDGGRRASFADAIIAGTALVHDLTIWTLDRDFAVLCEVEPSLRVHPAQG